MKQLVKTEHLGIEEKRLFWQRAVEGFQASKQTQIEYCRRNNLNKDHFVYYLKQYRRGKSQPQKTSNFIEVEVSPVTHNEQPWKLVLSSGLTLEIPNDFELQQLVLLLQQLRETRC